MSETHEVTERTEGREHSSDLTEVRDALVASGYEDLSAMIDGLRSGQLSQREQRTRLGELRVVLNSYKHDSEELAPAISDCLKMIEENFSDENDTPDEASQKKELTIDAVVGASQKIEYDDGSVRDPLGVVRRHIIEGDNRPDPAMRTWLYYGNQLPGKIDTEISDYTDYSKPELNFLAYAFREGFVRPQPRAAGSNGIGDVYESAKQVILDGVSRNFLNDKQLTSALDRSYLEALGLGTSFLKVCDIESLPKDKIPEARGKLGSLLSSKGVFDAYTNVLVINVEHNQDDVSSAIRDETYEVNFDRFMQQYNDFKSQLKNFRDYMVSDLGVDTDNAKIYYEEALANVVKPRIDNALVAYESVKKAANPKHLTQQSQLKKMSDGYFTRYDMAMLTGA